MRSSSSDFVSWCVKSRPNVWGKKHVRLYKKPKQWYGSKNVKQKKVEEC